MGLASMFGLGLLVGVVVTNIVYRLFLVGTLRIDASDPSDSPYMFLELSKGVDSITKKKYVLLKVNLNGFIPRK